MPQFIAQFTHYRLMGVKMWSLVWVLEIRIEIDFLVHLCCCLEGVSSKIGIDSFEVGIDSLGYQIPFYSLFFDQTK